MAGYDDLARSVMPFFSAGPILDIGGGEPAVLAAWRSRGFDAAAVDVTATKVSPGSLPYQSRRFSAVVVAHVLEHLAPEQLDAFITEAARLTARYLFIKVATRTPDRGPTLAIEQPRAWWEARLLESGFTKHPLCQRMTSYEGLERDEPDVLLAFERIPHQVLERFPLSALREERDLHMDMLREPGRRADAHVLRYTFASQFVHRQDRVLDAACGLGYGAAILHDAAGPVSVHGLDASEYAVDYASAVFGSRRPGVRFSKADVMDVAQLPDESVDVVTSFETLEHIADPRWFVREAARVLAPGGRFLCSVPNRWVDETGRDPN
ncbi:MAG: methyltransferase domain-containing protein, partial [Burkholderiales bacterium]